MRIGLQTWGTEGDLRPFFALAGALSARGHEVRLVTTNVEGRSLSALGQGAHVDEERVGAEYFREARTRIADGARENFRVKNPVKQLERILVDALDPVADAMFDAGRDLAEWADALVVHSMAHPAVSAAEATAKRAIGSKGRFGIRAYGGYSTGSAGLAKQRQIYLAGADPLEQFNNPFLRSQGALLVRPEDALQSLRQAGENRP